MEVAGDTSWLRDEASQTRIFDWWSLYRPQHYHLAGFADIISSTQTEYRWDSAAQGYQPHSDSYLAVYRRNDAN